MLVKNLIKYILSVLFLLDVFCSSAQGLLFKSIDSPLTKRTSFHVFDSDAPLFQDHFFIRFNLSLWDNANLGYVFNLVDKDNSFSLSYLFDKDQGTLNFNVDRKSTRIKILLDPSLLHGTWIHVLLNFDLKDDRISVLVNGKVYDANHMGFKRQMLANLTFGKNQFYTEVPNMAVKDLVIGDGIRIFTFPLNEWKGEKVHDLSGNPRGLVENPVWLMNRSYTWKPVLSVSEKAVAGINFSSTDQKLLIFTHDSLISYDPEMKQKTETAYQNKIPVQLVLGKSIFNARENKFYAYELFDVPQGTPGIASLSLGENRPQWTVTGKAGLPHQLHHHTVFYDSKYDSIYLFGGYGSYTYSNQFLRYDRAADKWVKTVFTGDRISPRFFAASGKSVNGDILYVFGGYGNESGNQVVGGKEYYDLFRIDLKTHTIKKCWDLRPATNVFVPANNLILSKDQHYFYVLCYPHAIARTALKLYRFSVRDGSYKIVSAALPVVSERIESDINLYFSLKTNEFYCVQQEFSDRKSSVIKVFSLLAPTFSDPGYRPVLKPAQKAYTVALYLGLTSFILLLIARFMILGKKVPKQSELPQPVEIRTAEAETIINTVYLLGPFQVIDKKGTDITHLFSPKIKQLFLLILLHNTSDKGVSSKKISCVLWPEKDLNKTKNIKGVTFNHLRNIISDIEGIDLVYVNDAYSFKLAENFFCDYFFLLDLIKRAGTDPSFSVMKHYTLILRGSFLDGMPEVWLDTFRNNYEENMIALIMPELRKRYELRELKQTLEISKLVLSMDPFNEEALKYQLNSCRKLKGVQHSKIIYDQYREDYRRSLGIEYPYSFEETLDLG